MSIVPKSVAFSMIACFSGSYGNDNPYRMDYQGCKHPFPILYPIAKGVWGYFERDRVNLSLHASAFTQANDLAWNPAKHYSIEKVLNATILPQMAEIGNSRIMEELSRIIRDSLDFQPTLMIPQDPAPAENNNDANSTEEAQLASPGQEQPKTEEGADDATSSSPEAQLPPEAQGEINGGPLGCCLGVMIGLLLSLSIAVISRFYADPLAQVLGGALNIVIRIAMALVAIIAVVVCGKFGWKIGKKLYREYDPPVIKDRWRSTRPKLSRRV